jgi:hypothetical protein
MKSHLPTLANAINVMRQGKLPVGLWARRQRSGKTYYYYCFDRKQKEVALGADLVSALQRYHEMERERLFCLHPRGMPVLTLIQQFARTDTGSPTRHGQTRRKHELRLLHQFFSDAGNPSVHALPRQTAYESWVSSQKERTGLDTIRLFRRLWALARRHGYVHSNCPWQETHQQPERVLMELSDVLYPSATPALRTLLATILLPERSVSEPARSPVNPADAASTEYRKLEAELSITKIVVLRTLLESHREDLIPSLEKLSVADLTGLITSSTRAAHIPPGSIDLQFAKSTAIRNLRNSRVRPSATANPSGTLRSSRNSF